MSNKPYSLHQFDIWYIMNMFSVYENEPEKLDKLEKLIVKYGYIPLEKLKSIEFLDDIYINLKLFPKEYHSLQEIDKRIKAGEGEITDKAFKRVGPILQKVYDKECKRQPIEKDERLLPLYRLLYREEQTNSHAFCRRQ